MSAPKRTLLNEALTLLLVRRTRHGEAIDAVITELAELSKTNPVDFACQVAEGLIGLGVLPDEPCRAHQLAERVRLRLGLPIGAHPHTSKRTLYRLWDRRATACGSNDGA